MHAEHADRAQLSDLSGRVTGCAFTVPNTLGVGFPKKVQENARRKNCAMLASRWTNSTESKYITMALWPAAAAPACWPLTCFSSS